MRRLTTLLVCTCVWITCINVRLILAFKEYHSCQNVKDDIGSSAVDGEYVVFLPWKQTVGISVYCYNLQTPNPRAFITLNSGTTSNFATFYDNVGSPTACADKYPNEMATQRGRTEFSRISVRLDTLTLDTGDFTFASTTGPNNIRYGEAGDQYAGSAECAPMGTFQIDLSGTPFTVRAGTQWSWSGSFVRGNVSQGQAVVDDDSFVGCYADKWERVLPSYKISLDNMTIEYCKSICLGRGQGFFGVEYHSECFCGDDKQRVANSRRAADSMCNYPCAGNKNQSCGGLWYISVYKTVSQRITGRCGGYPGRCAPSTTLALDIVHTCLASNPCLHEGRCIATSSTGYKCMCYPGYTGDNCEIVNKTIVDDGRTCPSGYQAETCMCFETSCNGAVFQGDVCTAATGRSQVTCRPGNPAHVVLYNKQATGWVQCPPGAQIVGCSYWANQPLTAFQGQGVVDQEGKCRIPNADATVTVQARCKEFVCGCENGGHCNSVTGRCECPQGYYGEKCETFDFCSYYEDINNNTAPCSATGVCTPVYKYTVTASGGDKAGDRCVFPFDWIDYTYNSCVEDNLVGPPFACAGEFALADDVKDAPTYIDLGPWSPGPRYTVAAWVSPWRIDTMRQTIVGGASNCNDFGFNFNSGTFRGYLKLSTECTRDLDTGPTLATIGTWYMVAITSNASHASIFVNGDLIDTNTVLLNHIPTTAGFWIGAAVCCSDDYFRGLIKTVKVWNHDLSAEDINESMYNTGMANSTNEAMYNGLVGHWELGDTVMPPCTGNGVVDHSGVDWILRDHDIISGIHCNISRFVVPEGVTVVVARYNGNGTGGVLDVTALEAQIDGYIDAVGAGYRGGSTPQAPGEGGVQGESYTGMGFQNIPENRGGGGGGIGGNHMTDGSGRSGGGGGYGTPGANGVKAAGDRTGLGAGGVMYGDPDVSRWYMGSGGGSGGNAKDLSVNPVGGRGGNGGGVVRIYAERSIIVTGVISVAGAAGNGDTPKGVGCISCPDACDLTSPVRCLGNSTTACWDMSGPGGGGSGGTIYLSAKLVNVGFQKLWAMGGAGGTGGGSCGGDGGLGRIRVDSVILKGIVSDNHAAVKLSTNQSQFIDLSQHGQKQINYMKTEFGNEVYRGCFRDDNNNRTLGVAIPSTAVTLGKMTPDFCKQACRQRNYMFSGTVEGRLCFCDNHLDMSRKADDGDCDTSCSGNPLWKCGGTQRVQVFGPPPSSPAVGKNVISRCRPWCVTTDADTTNPKWGQCELGGHQAAGISSWDVRCDCPPGKIGPGCDQLCPSWTYGNGCRRNCTCNQNTTSFCNPSNGQCVCQPGYQGSRCESQCPSGKYGKDCTSTCQCAAQSLCDPADGTCSCQPGFYGPNCAFPCEKGRFGANCSQSCASCNHGTCSPVDGLCECFPGFKLPYCAEMCDPTNFGQDCGQECKCNGQPCNPISGRCMCGPGYLGYSCETQCPVGLCGQGCLTNCSCQQGFGCDPVGCFCNCGPGFVGQFCEISCPAQSRSFGQSCQFTSNCVPNNTASINVTTGACTCKNGFYGNKCDVPCLTGLYGYNCSQTCTCRNGATCNPVDGTCACAPGFTGNDCSQTCPSNFYGNKCQTRCPSQCGGSCHFVDGSCNCQNGTPCNCPLNSAGRTSKCLSTCGCLNGVCEDNQSCTCKWGWNGAKCDSPCPPLTFGANCAGQCSCTFGSCNPTTGACLCASGYTGLRCDQPCTNNTFGPNCEFKCPDCGIFSLPGCDFVTGACACNTGYTGPLCRRPCPTNTYGDGCSKTCNCQNNGVCDNVSGKCSCPPGFTGETCQSVCPVGYYGDKCAKQCSCGPYGAGCTSDEGLCMCQPGFTGVKCRESCPAGMYGANCTSTCPCDTTTSMCSPVDGTCMCNSGFTGAACQSVCPRGFWGRNCSQQCQCSGSGNCDPFSGQCNCQAGYKGSRCELQCDQDIYWGQNCANLCSCNGAHCDHRDGTCRCPPGKMGHQCEMGCQRNYFGYQCAQPCSCKNDAVCDPVTGACRCQPGWAGNQCDQSCPIGYFGADCAQVCQNCYNDGTCDSFSGTCMCAPDFTGSQCNTSLTLAVGSPQKLQQQGSQSGVNMSSGHFAGMLVGIAILFVIGIVATVFITRKFAEGRFGSNPGAQKFSEEILATHMPTGTGFVNPVHHGYDDVAMETRSTRSDATSGVHSAKMDSDEDEEDDNNGFFKDSDS